MRDFLKAGLVVGLATLMSACAAEEAGGPDCGAPGTICTYLGNGIAGLGTDGVGPLEVALYLPQDLAFGPDGQPYVLDWNNHRVRTVGQDGLVRTVVGTGELGDAPDGPVLNASLNHPTHVAFSPTGKMIMSAWHNSKIVEVDLQKGEMRTICGTGARAYKGDGGPAVDSALDLPVAVTFDSMGQMYVSDQANQRVRKVDQDAKIDTVVGPNADWRAPGIVQVCVINELGQDWCKNCLESEKDDPGCADQPAGRPQGFAGDGGLASEAMLYLPFSQSAPPAGRIEMGPGDVLYIADSGNHRVRAFFPDGTIDTIAGSGPDKFDPAFSGGYSGDGGPANQAMLKRPTDIAVADDGTVYIADTDNSCVRAVNKAGVISTVAGVCGKKGFDGDGGSATEALLNRPYGVALDDQGNLYIADTHNHRIRVVYR